MVILKKMYIEGTFQVNERRTQPAFHLPKKHLLADGYSHRYAEIVQTAHFLADEAISSSGTPIYQYSFWTNAGREIIIFME